MALTSAAEAPVHPPLGEGRAQPIPTLTLVSHLLCPYVQRAVIVLKEKRVAFQRIDIDLAAKPDWFTKVSPLGKTPVLLAGQDAIFESAVICEYLDDTLAPRLHPEDALKRARHRAWMEFGSALLNTIAAFYNAPDDEALLARGRDLRTRFEQLEAALGSGPFFAGHDFSIVDAVFGPVFRYFAVFDPLDGFGLFGALPKLDTWRGALSARPSVRDAVRADYPELLRAFIRGRRSALSRRLTGAEQGGGRHRQDEALS